MSLGIALNSRYQQLLKEEEARVQRRRQEQQAKQTEHKLKYQALQERRMSLVTRRQAEVSTGPPGTLDVSGH